MPQMIFKTTFFLFIAVCLTLHNLITHAGTGQSTAGGTSQGGGADGGGGGRFGDGGASCGF